MMTNSTAKASTTCFTFIRYPRARSRSCRFFARSEADFAREASSAPPNRFSRSFGVGFPPAEIGATWPVR